MLDEKKEGKTSLFWGEIVVIIKTFFPSSFIHRATVTEEEIKEAFTASSFEVKAFKFFP